MRAVLRCMPRFMPRWIKWFIRVFVGILLLQYVFRFFWRHPFVAGGVTVSLLMFSFCSFAVTKRRLARLAAARPQDSWETFYRSLQGRCADKTIIRLVYAQIQDYLAEYPQFPLRGDDRLSEDLTIDEGDLEDMLENILRSSGRSLTGYEQNPHYGCVKTVADLILFVDAQSSSQDSNTVS